MPQGICNSTPLAASTIAQGVGILHDFDLVSTGEDWF